jgi:hypothetical protein
MKIDSDSKIGELVAAHLEAAPILEADLQQHVHLENNIPFPRAVRLEANLGIRAT